MRNLVFGFFLQYLLVFVGAQQLDLEFLSIGWLQNKMNTLPKQLRDRACPAGKPWTVDDPVSDHGHTDCYLLHQAADMIEDLEKKLAALRDLNQSYRIRLENFRKGETRANIPS